MPCAGFQHFPPHATMEDSAHISTFTHTADAAELHFLAEQLADDDPVKPYHLAAAAEHFEDHFSDTRQVDDIDQAISIRRKVCELTPDEHEDWARRLLMLATCLLSRFAYTQQADDFEQAILVQRKVCQMTPDEHKDQALYRSMLAISLQIRFKLCGSPSDETELLTLLRVAAELDETAWALNRLAEGLFIRFEREFDITDIDEAIEAQKKAVELAPIHDAAEPDGLNFLGDLFSARFKHVGNSTDLDEAILLRRQNVELIRNGDSDKLQYISKLADSLQTRILRARGNPMGTDLDEEVTLRRAAAEYIPNGHAVQARIIMELANALAIRFLAQETNPIGDLKEALSLYRCTAEMKLDDPSARATCLSKLGNTYLGAFVKLSDFSYLEDSIAVQREAVDIMPPEINLRDMAVIEYTLGQTLVECYQRRGDLKDLEEAITLHSRGIASLPDVFTGKQQHIRDLGVCYLKRFDRLGELDDLQRAISLMHRAVDLDSGTRYLVDLAELYERRWWYRKNMHDLDQVIVFRRQSLDAVPSGRLLERRGLMGDLGYCYAIRYRYQGRLEDWEEATALQMSSIEATPDDSPVKRVQLRTWASSLSYRFYHSKNLKDIQDAIAMQKRVVGLTPQGHFERPRVLWTLACRYHAELSSQPSESSFLSASEALREAAYITAGPLTAQFDAATLLRTLYEEFPQFCGPSHNILDVHQRVVDLLPQVAWMGLSVSRRYEELGREIGDAVGAATAAALAANDPERALKWFEGGRAVVWSQTLNLRTPLDGLQKAHPEHAERIREITVTLQQGGYGDRMHTKDMLSMENRLSMEDTLSTDKQASDYRLLADEYGKKVEEVRQLPGFDNFLRPRRIHDLYPAASGGPVVCINMHESRCDALILCNGSVFHVPLPKLSPSIAESMRDEWGSYLGSLGVQSRNYRAGVARDWDDVDPGEILARLWDVVVLPVLKFVTEKIPLDANNTTDGLPHITWCTTGALAFLPLHAAGRYEDGVGDNAFDSIISSYTPTLASLLAAPRKSDDAVSPRIAIAAQPNTPIAALFSPPAIRLLIGQDGTTQNVLEAMSEYRWIHLACHGTQNTSNPAQSAFLLHDRPLSLEELMKTTSNVGELAFLSACETATGDEDVPDEAVHLAAGMLAAGYRSVVATMWEIGDRVAPVVAEAFYQTLLQEMDAGRGMNVAYALHEAVKRVRDRVGKESFAAWVPFVHYGL
ncbi:hypothetical protein CYLTODRAFT_489937 [Cylindrobasidium torrendii FP15055 ss-10]|uniref:CHAT domain-containing protein n=1 Tax=Cylindrobasidium torrendii FP15055 ss-10 TaxID=1314674 RepID=A0A0D7BDM5_9AGAR|nr:hypothetical protein CYLTODRAFT_489937 [Cylindrobasidium torrendii FP15055 ss-10]